MWIIPKTLSAFVQDTEGLRLALDERAWMLEQSAMWRSKPSSKQTWLRRLKKDAWMTRLSTRILKPSLHESFEEKYTGSLEDIPVSRFQARESEKERKTQDTCGPTSESMSGQLDLFGAFSKMSEVTPRWGYGESCPIWKKMVTERSGDCSQRRKQARLTNASDASSWPTASARDHKGGYTGGRIRNGKVSMDTLDVAVQAHTDGGILSNWPTPRAGNPGSRKPGTGGKILAEEAKIYNGLPAPEKSSTSGKNHGSWATPQAEDHNSTSCRNKTGSNQKCLGRDMTRQGLSPKLNPNWVEQLMGLSTGWTDLGSWGTELSHKPQK